ncbi:agamous-like MADS-box protein AGL15 [Henckelia pumila]|uniref:agamous-like MADS-box protein AGL15 n=1 Tax=Henckelia pumila TaxID=405737 RepID=UPI003C6E49B0
MDSRNKRKSNSSIDKSAYKKRCGCLKKKAHELATLCDSQVALFGYSEDGELFEYASSRHVLGMDLERMSREDLLELERQLNEGLLCIMDKKEAILVQQLEQSRNQEQQYMKENESLRMKVEQLEKLCERTTSYQPLCIEYQLMPLSGFAPGEGLHYGSQMACTTSSGDANDHVDLSLQLGPPDSKVCGRSQTQHEGTRSTTADTFLTLWVQETV